VILFISLESLKKPVILGTYRLKPVIDYQGVSSQLSLRLMPFLALFFLHVICFWLQSKEFFL